MTILLLTNLLLHFRPFEQNNGCRIWLNHKNYENKLYVLPRHLDEKVAGLHLSKIGVVLYKLTTAQAEYLGISKEGPFKSDLYRY